METERFTSHDGKILSLYIWDKCENPKAVVRISHGMAEHMKRYDDFALFLNKNKILVAGEDHRAHGETDKDFLGKTSDKDLFSATVSDGMEINKYLKEKYGLPIILLGHSYGSFLAQSEILTDSSILSGAILMGSAFNSGLALNVGSFLANRKVKKGKGEEKGDTFANMTFISYDKKLKCGKNGWLSTDSAQVEKYNNDHYCGFICSNGFYESFFKGLKKIASSDFSKIDKNLKILIVSGGKDQVGGNGKLVVKLYEKFVKNGINPMLKLYDNARHEILNETIKDTVYKDIADFILKCV